MSNLKRNDLLKALLQHSDAIIIYLATDFSIFGLSNSAEKFYNWQDQEVCGKNYLELCQSSGYTCPIEPHFFENPILLKFNLTTRYSLGKQKNINWTISPIMRHANHVDGVVLIGENIDLKKNDIAEHLNEIIDCVPGCLYWKDVNGHYLGCNDTLLETLNLLKEDIVGKTDYDLWPTHAEQLLKHDKEVMKTARPLRLEEQVTLQEKEHYYTVIKIPLKDQQGDIIGIIGNSLDITAEKEAAQLRQEKEIAEQKALYLRAAAGSIAHELRTPLASIKMASEFIAKFWRTLLSTYKLARTKQLEVDEIPNRALMQLEGRIDSVLQQTHYANSFIDLVLGNLKEEQDINTDKYRVCNIVDVVSQCLLRYPFIEGEEPLLHWNSDNEFEFIGDEFFMLNVLNNLIKNSLYFIKEARKGEMFIWLEKGESRNTLYFKDTAKGAPEEVVAHLFESFYSKRQGGTGLGLAFCKKIMNSFGGDIVVESVESEYMQFALHFPALSNKQ